MQTQRTHIAAEFTPDGYFERTRRNHHWIGGASNQEKLKALRVGIAGVGCFGSGVAVQLVRAGVGHIRIADPDIVEASNINRQVMATVESIGEPKVDALSKMLRAIAKDFELLAYSDGITPDNVDVFVEGCDVVIDEIDVFAPGRRVLLHRAARERGIPIYAACALGLGVRLYKFEGEAYTLEQFLEIDETASATSIEQLLKHLGQPFPSYLNQGGLDAYSEQFERDGAAALFGPVAAIGFSLLTTRIIFDRLGLPLKKRNPVMPEFIALDVADMTYEVSRVPDALVDNY